MNREIKFRVFDVLRKKMKRLYTISFEFSTDKGHLITAESEEGQTTDFAYRFIIMQYTGLKDKNGKEIFEGDIVSIEYGKGVVEYSEKQAMFIINWIGDNEAYNESLAYNPRNYIYGKTRKDIEVIGNIYENSYLLK